MRQNSRKIYIIWAVASVVAIALFVLIGWIALHHSSVTPPIQPISSSTPAGDGSSSSTISTSTTSQPSSTIVTPPSKPLINVGHALGIAAGGGLSKMSTTTLNAELDQMVALGVTWVRFDIEWGDVQYSSSSSFTWGNYDRLIGALAAHHLHGLGIILFTPGWARANGCDNGVECPPANPSTYATFAAEIAARYKSDGMHDWEIWNEPNNYNFWAPKTDCVAYTALLQAAYPAIKQADPNAVVVTGGLAPESTDSNNTSPTDFLNCVYNAGGKNYFDAVGNHPYTFPAFPSSTGSGAWNQMSTTNPSLRSIMVANGDANKKIWITEFGVPTNGPDPHWYVSESQQAEMVAATFQLYESYSWAGPLFWYSFQDAGNTTNTNENFFGLVRADGSTKPAYQTLKNIITAGLQ